MKNGRLLNRQFFQTLLWVLISLSGSACYNQQSDRDKKATTESNEAKFNAVDKEKDAQFLTKSAEISLEAIKLGQLAQQKSTNIDVQELGKTMEEEYGKLFNDMVNLGQNKAILIPTVPSDAAQETYKQLINMLLINFDKAYCDTVVDRYQRITALFQRAFTESADDAIRRWALVKLPELRQHLELALICQKKLASTK